MNRNTHCEEAIARGRNGSFWLKDVDSAIDLPEVQELALDPFVLSVLQDLMGVPPIIRAVDISFNVLLAHGSAEDFDFTSWHKDFNSVRTVKLLVYLSDALDDASGPHTYIPGTQEVMGDQTSPGFMQELSAQKLEEDELHANTFTQGMAKLYGPAGTVPWLFSWLACKTSIVWVIIFSVKLKPKVSSFTFRRDSEVNPGMVGRHPCLPHG